MLQGKTVVVTGVGPGLGREVAACALRDGANVVVAARNEERLAEIAGELDASGDRILARATDITSAEGCQALMAAAVERFSKLDAVVQVAAMDTLFGTLETTSADDWAKSMNVNVVGTMQVAAAAVPRLEAAGGGSIVLVGSQSMWLPPPMKQIAYAAAKGAVVSAMYHMAEELGPKRIRVNMVVPTWMWGPPVELYVRWQAGERGISEEEMKREITSRMPLGEIPADEDVAEAIVFFCSDRARMITAETLMVNGGELMR